IGYRHVAAAMELVQRPGDRAIDLPGLRVERIGARLVLVSRPVGARGRWPHEESAFRQPLSVPGEVRVAGTGTVTAEAIGSAAVDASTAAGRGPSAAVRADLCGSLAVRNRRPGDRFRPVGLNGT